MTLPLVDEVGTMTATWIDPDGVEWPLSLTADDPGWFTTNGPAGWGATPIEIVTDPRTRGGEQPRFIRDKPRRLQWPIYIGGDTHLEYTQRRRAITRAFTMTKQRLYHGWLRVARSDGSARRIACYYEQGLEGESGEGHTFSRDVVTLFCPDGYWQDVLPLTETRTFVIDDAPFLNPFITIISSAVVSGDGTDPNTEITNPGEVDSWPQWTVIGPMAKLTATNHTLGLRFAVTYSLAAGQQMVIYTDPRPMVRGPGELNLSKYVDWFNPLGTALWPLTDGLNELSFQIDGAGVGSLVELLFYPRYETA